MDAKQLKKARELLDMNQEELGTALGFTSRIQIGKYERGETKIPKTTELSIRYLLIKSRFPDISG